MKTDIKKTLINTKKEYISLELNSTNKDEFLDRLASKICESEIIVEIQINNISDFEALPILKKARQICSIYNSLLIIKTRIDISEIINSDGVSLELNKDIPLQDAKKLVHDDKIFSCIFSDPQEYENLNEIDSDIIITKKEFLDGLNLNLNGSDLIYYLISKSNKIIFTDEQFIKENKIDNNSKIKLFRI